MSEPHTLDAPVSTPHVQGTFCWWEIATDDLDAAQAFYGPLFDWTFETYPIENDQVYVMAKRDGGEVLGLYKLHRAQQEQNVPPHWMPYFAVDHADHTVAAATRLGGTAVMPAFDVYEQGRMSVIQDPQGAYFSIWQAKQHKGAAKTDGLGCVWWTELATTNRDGAAAFYAQLFGFDKEQQHIGGGPYVTLKHGDIPKAGILEMDERWGDVAPHFLSYVGVDDCDARTEQANTLGGAVYVPPTDIPGIGRFAVLADPSGAVFAIMSAPC